MALFNKNTKLKNDDLQEPTEKNTQENQSDKTTLEQLETTIAGLVEKIKLFSEKNQQHIHLQKGKLETASGQLQILENQSNANHYLLNSGKVKGFELEKLGKELAALNEKVTNKRHEIKSLELDIAILERTRDEESLKALVQAWEAYETKMFNEFISPLEVEITAAKGFYFEKLKQLRNKYNMLEGLTVHINSISLNNEHINLYNWVNAIHNKPQLLITRDDALKELTITQTYRAE